MNRVGKRIILITGGAGFIGSHLVELMVKKYSNYHIINLDLLTYAADESRLDIIKNEPNYSFIKADIRDYDGINKIFQDNQIDGVIHLAAESHVDNSIKNPRIFYDTNVMGTQVLLDCAKKLWMEQLGVLSEKFSHARFLHVSTDEVYGTLGENGFFSETTPYAPNSPYSSSKAASDFVVRSYFHTYNLPAVITNCSNNFGPKQHDEKLIPTIIRNAILGKDIPIYGNGKNIRDWLYVKDHCGAIDLVFHQGKLGESYNIGTRNEKSNYDMALKICDILDRVSPKNNGKYEGRITYVQDRAGHDFRYAIDNTKICSELGWKSEGFFDKDLEETVRWYLDFYSDK